MNTMILAISKIQGDYISKIVLKMECSIPLNISQISDQTIW
jgi:hypothetical protein